MSLEECLNHILKELNEVKDRLAKVEQEKEAAQESAKAIIEECEKVVQSN